MKSIYTELALYGSKHECARTDTVFLPISEVCNGTVSLGKGLLYVFPLNPMSDSECLCLVLLSVCES